MADIEPNPWGRGLNARISNPANDIAPECGNCVPINWRFTLAMILNSLAWFGLAVWLADGFQTLKYWLGWS